MIAIDLGSNTIRACKMRLLDSGNFECEYSFERIVGSARGLNHKGLADDAMSRIRAAISELVSEAKFNSSTAVATEAFRKAANSDEFFARIYDDFGIKFKIISGEYEAFLTRLGVSNRAKILGLKIDNSVLIDLGGASTEISFGDDSKSFDFGIITAIESDKSGTISQAKSFMDKFKFNSIILTSGVPTTVACLKYGLNYYNYNANLVNGTRLDRSDFINTINLLKTAFNKDELVGKNRADLIVKGCEILLEFVGNSTCVAIDDGLREGLFIANQLNLKEKK
ncbi:Ppx/GppA phosphatase family protein [Campylobacter porcelli]|uniref:Disulfide bond formation protein DsbA n=1 Tax=Campylobacter porcelli TaxID=1660073 RepID=A0ABU7M5D8_9BACT|nr:disulfide bond formation protein DsbA [Campylobacter sp. CX2-4855-23]MEE3776360.1 disulfide bond formation protein DsbA [Campylobacter sp. CX2-4080-23]